MLLECDVIIILLFTMCDGNYVGCVSTVMMKKC